MNAKKVAPASNEAKALSKDAMVKGAYRAPRVVDLGAAVKLVQDAGGLYWDGNARTMVRTGP